VEDLDAHVHLEKWLLNESIWYSCIYTLLLLPLLLLVSVRHVGQACISESYSRLAGSTSRERLEISDLQVRALKGLEARTGTTEKSSIGTLHPPTNC